MRVIGRIDIPRSDLGVLDDPFATRKWISGLFSTGSDSAEEPLVSVWAVVQANPAICYGRIRTLLAALCDHKLVTGLTLAANVAAKNRRPDRDFDIVVLKRTPALDPDEGIFPLLRVQIMADRNGGPIRVAIGKRLLGTGDDAIDDLNSQVLKIIGQPGNPLTDDLAVALGAYENVSYGHVRKAIRAVVGRSTRRGWVPYLRKVVLLGVGAPLPGIGTKVRRAKPPEDLQIRIAPPELNRQFR